MCDVRMGEVKVKCEGEKVKVRMQLVEAYYTWSRMCEFGISLLSFQDIPT